MLQADPILQTKELSVYYGDNRVVTEVTLDVLRNRITAIIGPSGSGKSTVSRQVARSLGWRFVDTDDEIVAAVIIAKEAVEADALLALCRDSLAVYKVPRKVKFVTYAELPLTSTGKLQKNRIKDLFE